MNVLRGQEASLESSKDLNRSSRSPLRIVRSKLCLRSSKPGKPGRSVTQPASWAAKQQANPAS